MTPSPHSAFLPTVGFAEPDALDRSRWFAEQVQPHEQALRAYLSKRFPMLPDHDDVVQEAYARLMRMKDPRRLNYTKAFLFTTARNVAIDMFRRGQRAVHAPIAEDDALPLLDEAPGVLDTLERLGWDNQTRNARNEVVDRGPISKNLHQEITTATLGAVYHVTHRISAFANRGESFQPLGAALSIDDSALPPLLNKGVDVGFRIRLFGDRVSASAA